MADLEKTEFIESVFVEKYEPEHIEYVKRITGVEDPSIDLLRRYIYPHRFVSNLPTKETDLS